MGRLMPAPTYNDTATSSRKWKWGRDSFFTIRKMRPDPFFCPRYGRECVGEGPATEMSGAGGAFAGESLSERDGHDRNHSGVARHEIDRLRSAVEPLELFADAVERDLLLLPLAA